MPDHKASCSLPNRDEALEAYVLGKLTDEEEEQLEAHVYECETCFRELQFQEDLKQVVNRSPDHSFAELKAMPWYNKIPSGRGWLAAAAVLLILVTAGIYRAALPIYFLEAELTNTEQEYLRAELRGESPQAADSEKGARALLAVRKNRIPFFPYFPHFDHNRAEEAKTHFSISFENSADPIKRNEYAFFLAKACLMQTDVESACAWLQRIIDSPATLNKTKAIELRRKIGC